MQALGMIETKGLLAAIESADAMLKAADVTLLERTLVGGGLVTITVTGEVAATKASIDAAVAAVNRLDPALLISQHVIPRPHVEVGETIINTVPLIELQNESGEKKAPAIKAETVKVEAAKAEIEKTKPESEKKTVAKKEAKAETIKTEAKEIVKEETDAEVSDMHKEDMDKLVETKGLEAALDKVGKCKVVKLRNLAREFDGFGISGRMISKANKDVLLEEFRKYYTK